MEEGFSTYKYETQEIFAITDDTQHYCRGQCGVLTGGGFLISRGGLTLELLSVGLGVAFEFEFVFELELEFAFEFAVMLALDMFEFLGAT